MLRYLYVCINVRCLLQITTEKELGKTPEGPKHGRVDPSGAPHVGGNQWAGGTGKGVSVIVSVKLLYIHVSHDSCRTTAAIVQFEDILMPNAPV